MKNTTSTFRLALLRLPGLKLPLILTSALCLLLLCSFKPHQDDPNNYELEIKALMKSQGYTISTTQFAEISQGNTMYHWKQFSADLDYAIYAFPEVKGVEDVDIYLYDSDGETLLRKSVTSGSKYEVLNYTPLLTRDMKIVVKNYKSESATSTYKIKFIVFYK